jgi:hypothetical protein
MQTEAEITKKDRSLSSFAADVTAACFKEESFQSAVEPMAIIINMQAPTGQFMGAQHSSEKMQSQSQALEYCGFFFFSSFNLFRGA